MRFPSNKSTRQCGFTLIELVAVIIILSALGIMTSSFIGTGVNIYTGIADRDKTLNSVRFVMERLRREVANALPNSAYVDAAGCLRFTPIVASTLYRDFPVKPVISNMGTIVPIDNKEVDLTKTKAVVYLLTSAKGKKNNSIKGINAVNADKDTLTFADSLGFPLGSPAKRVYFIKDDIRYCFTGSKLNRQVIGGDVVLMAEKITGDFAVENATLQRNGLVQAKFSLDFDGQEVPIEQTLHINNVP